MSADEGRLIELEAQLRVLEHENEMLTDRAEDSALLGAVAGVGANTAEQVPEQLIEPLLEGLSLLKALPFTALVELEAAPTPRVRELGRYCSMGNERDVGLQVPLELFDLERPRYGPPGGEAFRGLVVSPPAGSFALKTLGVFPVRCEAMPQGLLILGDDQHAERLPQLQPLVEQLLTLVCDKLDKLFYLRRLQRTADDHERKAEERGEQLDRVNAELRRAQRMESLGRLAGSLAHDFNNLLSPIISYAELLAQDLAERPDQLADLDEIQFAAKRAGELTQQILAFSRKQVLEVKVVDLGAVLQGFSRVLRGALREDVTLEVRLPPSKALITADGSQLEQILLNLVINAQDAMPRGGRVEISVTQRQASAPADAEQRARSWAVLSVVDDGCGMDAATQAMVFEPFFSTKPEGKGTGLGLSTVYGIVAQHGGFIEMWSEPDAGCRFDLSFPHASSAEEVERPQKGNGRLHASARNQETILVVEDEPMVRKLACRILGRAGYQVLEAADAAAAERVVAGRAAPIDLLLTDVVMPGKNGRELFEELVLNQPELRVLYTSGHSEDVLGYQGLVEAGTALLKKPVMPLELVAKVREILDA
jgi:signal transduction histidine kinase/CheY-like chemotaxis protein